MSKKKRSGASLYWGVAVLSILVLGYGIGPGNWFGEEEVQALEGVAVRRGPLRIAVVERGNLKAKDAVSLKCELEGRPTILSLVPEGTRVTAGTLVAELDSSGLQDNLVSQGISVQNAEAAFTKARESRAIQALQNTSDIAAGEQALAFAKSDLEKYVEGDWPQQLQEADEAILLAKEEMKRAEDKLKWSEELEGKGFLTRTELEGDRLAFERNRILRDQAERKKQLLIEFDHPKEKVRLEAAVTEAERELERIKLQADSRIIDFEADERTSEARFDLEKEKLAKIENQIEKAKMYAPVDGMVVYGRERGGRWRGNDPISEGTEVRERQEIISIPTAGGMIAEASIHESVLEQVEVGQHVTVTVDAMPGREFEGEVSFVALLPDQNSWWANPDLRVYRSEIQLTSESDEMRPGMSCSLEILIDELDDATYVPLQSVLPHDGGQICFVSKGGQIEMRAVKVGLNNDRWVQILEGLEEGEIVLLSPPAGYEPSSSKDDEGDRRQQDKRRERSDSGERKKTRSKGGPSGEGRPGAGAAHATPGAPSSQASAPSGGSSGQSK